MTNPGKDQALRDIAKDWSPAEWENYLQSLEGALKESQAALLDIGRPHMAANIDEISPSLSFDSLVKDVDRLLKALTEKQLFVIKKIFWEGLSEGQVARLMGISRQGVFDMKKRAIRKLKRRASKVLGSFPIVRAQVDMKDPP